MLSRTTSMDIFLISLLVGIFLFNAEAAFLCSPSETPEEFKCSNGKCTYIRNLCDGDNDCGDGSDEKFCDSYHCHPLALQCLNGKCISRRNFYSGGNDCLDNSDERYCDIDSSVSCPSNWSRCPNERRCIPSSWVCDGLDDCAGESEEINCRTQTEMTSTHTAVTSPPSTAVSSPATIAVTSPATTAVTSPASTAVSSPATIAVTSPATTAVISPEYGVAKAKLKTWFLRRKKPGSKTDRWGSQVHRIAVALHLADDSTFSPGNSTGEEIRYELTAQLLHRLAKEKRMSSHELALYIHALLVACMDPKDFYGDDLVIELRRRVEASGNYTNPFLILVLCNAGNAMTTKDAERVTTAYDSQHRPFWTDYQALASMALSCMSSRGGVSVDERTLRAMLQELKRRQFRNGTVDNFRTTALVTQALFIHNSYLKDFDLDSAVKVLVDGLNGSKSLLNFYYALPVLYRKSLLNVTSSHCIKQPVAEEEALQNVLDVSGETITVMYSIWMGEEINLGRTWRLRMRTKSTIYDAIETVAKIDNRQKVEYNVVDGKPYVTALNGKEDDPEMGMFWFIYLKTLTSDKDPKMMEESPVDIKLHPNQEIILWYKRAIWSNQNLMQKSANSA